MNRQSRGKNKFYAGAALVLAIWIAAAPAAAQNASASLTGVTSDEAGKVIFNAEVTLTSGITGAARTTKTDSKGAYLFTGLLPGTYALAISAVNKGFETIEAKNIVLLAEHTIHVDAILRAGQLNNIEPPLDHSPSGTGTPRISVRLVQPQHAFGIKQGIRLRVELSNEGDQTLLVCRDLDVASDSCHWSFEVHDAAGQPVPGWKLAGDRGDGPPDPFPNVLISNWIALAPHYIYGTAIDASLALGPNPRPGRYKIKGTLSSGGPDEASSKNDLPRYPKELAALPFGGWKGKAESNSVWIEIKASR